MVKNLVDDYKIEKPRYPRYYESTNTTLLRTKHWLTTRVFFSTEVIPILNEEIKLERIPFGNYPDILFEYLVIRAVTILEIQLKYYCNFFVKKFPKRAEKLLKKRDRKKDLALQILSTYSFSNIKDIKHVFSTLLGKDFFQLLKHRSEEYKSSIGYESDHIYRASPLFKKWEMFEKIIKLRNRLIHENKRIRIKSKKDRKNLLNAIYEVNYLTSLEELHLPYDKYSFSQINPHY